MEIVKTKLQYLEEEYQMFVREWRFNHKGKAIPTIPEWKKWFRVVNRYSNNNIKSYENTKRNELSRQVR